MPGVYDGNQLPESPTSQFQMAVSVLYTLFISVMLGIGAFAVLAAQQKPDKEAPAILYMCALLRKHNAVAHGILAFIPATYSLTHLYTNSLHNGSLYTASNIVYVAVFGFAAKYLGEALQALKEDAINMDTIKAVHECLFMLTRSYARLQAHNPSILSCDQAASKMLTGLTDTLEASDCDISGGGGDSSKRWGRNKAWTSPWVLLNAFLAIGAQDDSRLWVMLPSWSLRWTWRANTLDHYRAATESPTHRLWRCLAGSVCLCCRGLVRCICEPSTFVAECCRNLCICVGGSDPSAKKDSSPKPCSCCGGVHMVRCCVSAPGTVANSGYAYWLFSQGSSVRNFTGSLVVKQGIADKLNQASYTTGELFITARRFMVVFTAHFRAALGQLFYNIGGSRDLVFKCHNGTLIPLADLTSCLLRVNFDSQALNMACERYMCRLTPAAAATCLPAAPLVHAMVACWCELFGRDAGSLALLQESLRAKIVASGTNGNAGSAPNPGDYPGSYWCCLWLQYMHMVLLGVDLLRMHNNTDLFKDDRQEKGYYKILSGVHAASLASSTAVSAAKAAAGVAGRVAEDATRDARVQARAEAAAAAAAAALAVGAASEDEKLQFADLHNMCDENLHHMASMVATLLLAQQMYADAGEGSSFPSIALPEVPLTALEGVKLTAKAAPYGPQPLPAQSVVSHAVLQRRCELVASHSSLPAVVQGVNCLSVSDWVDGLQGYLAGALMLLALSSISIATIACSNGVQLVSIAGALQAFFAWGLLLHTARLPVLPPVPSGGVGPPWLLQRCLGSLCLLADLLLCLLLTLASLFNMLVPVELLVLLDGIFCSSCLLDAAAKKAAADKAAADKAAADAAAADKAVADAAAADKAAADAAAADKAAADAAAADKAAADAAAADKAAADKAAADATTTGAACPPGKMADPDCWIICFGQQSCPADECAGKLGCSSCLPDSSNSSGSGSSSLLKGYHADLATAACRAGAAALAAAAAAATGAVCVRATEVYQDIGHDNCTCLFVQPSELDQKLKDVLSAGKQVVVAAKAAEQDYIAEAVEHAFKGVEKQGLDKGGGSSFQPSPGNIQADVDGEQLSFVPVKNDGGGDCLFYSFWQAFRSTKANPGREQASILRKEVVEAYKEMSPQQVEAQLDRERGGYSSPPEGMEAALHDIRYGRDCSVTPSLDALAACHGVRVRVVQQLEHTGDKKGGYTLVYDTRPPGSRLAIGSDNQSSRDLFIFMSKRETDAQRGHFEALRPAHQQWSLQMPPAGVQLPNNTHSPPAAPLAGSSSSSTTAAPVPSQDPKTGNPSAAPLAASSSSATVGPAPSVDANTGNPPAAPPAGSSSSATAGPAPSQDPNNPAPVQGMDRGASTPGHDWTKLHADCSTFMWVANRLLYTGFVGRHVHLGNMMDADAAHAYRSRISAADVAVYAFVTLSLVGFTVCAVLAYKYEPFYSTAIGMCLGRCHNREDCMLNMTLDLPPFEGGATPGCPGKGWLDTPPPNASTPQLQECPVINSTFIKSG